MKFVGLLKPISAITGIFDVKKHRVEDSIYYFELCPSKNSSVLIEKTLLFLRETLIHECNVILTYRPVDNIPLCTACK